MNIDKLRLDPKRLPKTLHLNRSKGKNQKFVFWDIETRPIQRDKGQDLEFKLAVLWPCTITPQGEKINALTIPCTTRDMFLKEFDKLASQYSSLTFMAHNTQFDLRYSKLLEHITSNAGKVESLYMSQGTNVITTNYKNHKQVFLDSMNWYAFSLAKLGDMVNENKGDINFENCSDQELMAYCKQDVRVMIYAFMRYKKWLHDNFGTNISYTRGADAFGIWRRSRNAECVTLHNNLEVLKNETRAYYGGRTEAFKLGNLSGKNWVKIDVNSLYPYVMSVCKYPVKYRGKIVDTDRYSLLSLMDMYCVLAKVKCNINSPYLPKYDRKGVYFPTGNIEGWFTGAELKHLLYNSIGLEVIEAHSYEQEDIFSHVIASLMRTKVKAELENNEIDRTMSKLIMNSIYGKFAQRTDELEYMEDIDSIKYGSFQRVDENNGEVTTYTVINGQVYLKNPTYIGKNSSPIISATVTSNARMYLYMAMLEVGIENIAYVDTDSIIMKDSDELLAKLPIHGTDLGKWKIEGRSNSLSVISPKNYTFGDESHRKGIPKKAIEVEPNTWEFQRIKTLKALLHKDSDEIPHVHNVTRKLLSQYWKAILSRDHVYTPFSI